MKFGELLKKLRKEKKISIRNFAKLIGISSSSLMDIEHGRCLIPKKETVEKMNSELSPITNELLELANEEKNANFALKTLVKRFQREPELMMAVTRWAEGKSNDEIREHFEENLRCRE